MCYLAVMRLTWIPVYYTIELEAAALHDTALPFSGRWFARPASVDLIAVPAT